MRTVKWFVTLSILGVIAGCSPLERTNPSNDRKNVIFILSDDHRHDFMGFTGKVPFLKTPNLDRMAREGAHLQNAFVTTSLCSPSRASILTGQYAHNHKVVDNQSLIPEGTTFFPKYLQEADYQTAFIGKWHMGEHHGEPRPGFDFWASFLGQGVYYNPVINFNGKEVPHMDSAYVSDVLTDYAMKFLKERDSEKPFFLYLSHKGVHADFQPARRHQGTYSNEPVAYPASMYPPGHEKSSLDTTQYDYRNLPDWVKKQRTSWHGVDYMYHGQIAFDDFYRRYCETLLSIDESVGTVLDYLEKEGLMENTLVVYMGDNGFSFGEHGLIDKRHAYEESIRVPLLAMGAGISPGKKVSQVIKNIDIGPTIMDYAGLNQKANMDGQSFKKLLEGGQMVWNDTLFYEYFWERPFPQTPTIHAVRTSRYKFIRYHGIWDTNELYDMENDPQELHNLIGDPAYAEIALQLRNSLFHWLETTGGETMPLKPDYGKRFDHLYQGTY